MMTKLARIKGVEPMDTPCNFLLVTVRKTTADLRQSLTKRNILIDVFEEGGGKTYMRLPLRGRRENARLAKTLSRVMAEEA